MAIIEGLAVAATWDGRRLDRHQWTQAMRTLDLAPPIAALLAPTDFITRYQGISYTVCGSFAHHFREVYGREALARAYRTGDFAAAAGRPLQTLAAEWGQFVDAQELPDGALAQARAIFDRPSIFRRVCARDIAARARAARTALQRSKLADSLALVEGILADIPQDVRHRLSQIQLLFLLDREPEARVIAKALSEDATAGTLARARAAEWLADLDALGDRPDAETRYSAALADTFDRAVRRRLWVKRAALSQPAPVRRLVLAHLIRPADGDARAQRVDEIVTAAPEWSVGHYLRGRVKLANQPPLEGLRSLQRARAGAENEDVELEIRRLFAATVFREDCYSRAASQYASLASMQGWDRGERATWARWARRAQFFAAEAGSEPEHCNSLIDIISRPSEDGAAVGNRPPTKGVVSPRPQLDDGDPR